MTVGMKEINKKRPTATNSRTPVNSLQCAFTVLNFNTKGAIMEKIDKYLEEIEAAMCKMDPIEQDRLMEVIRISFPEYFDGNYMKS